MKVNSKALYNPLGMAIINSLADEDRMAIVCDPTYPDVDLDVIVNGQHVDVESLVGAMQYAVDKCNNNRHELPTMDQVSNATLHRSEIEGYKKRIAELEYSIEDLKLELAVKNECCNVLRFNLEKECNINDISAVEVTYDKYNHTTIRAVKYKGIGISKSLWNYRGIDCSGIPNEDFIKIAFVLYDELVQRFGETNVNWYKKVCKCLELCDDRCLLDKINSYRYEHEKKLILKAGAIKVK